MDRRTSAARCAGVVLVVASLGLSGAVAVHGGGTQLAPDAAARRVVAAAKSHVGEKYVFGATGPSTWDCSGLTSTLWRTAGGVAAIPRTARDQQAWAWPIARSDARPGDLVFFGSPVTHVAIYAGDGRIVDASSSKHAVVERALWADPTERFGRVPRAGVPHPGAPVVDMAPFIAAARTRVGARWAPHSSGPRYDAAGVVRWAWWKAGYGVLPSTPAAIERLTTPVSARDARPGDLVFYGRPAVHVAVYVGNGEMVDASKVLRVVSQRAVFTSETVRFGRL